MYVPRQVLIFPVSFGYRTSTHFVVKVSELFPCIAYSYVCGFSPLPAERNNTNALADDFSDGSHPGWENGPKSVENSRFVQNYEGGLCLPLCSLHRSRTFYVYEREAA